MKRIRLSLLVLLLLSGTALTAWAPSAQGAARFVASFTLAEPPSWQGSAAKAEKGSWVKHSSPVVADLGPHGRAIVVADQGGRVTALKFSGGKLTKLWDTGGAIATHIDSSPAVADLDRNGCPEVIVGAGNEFRPTDSGIHVFDCNGKNHRFWAAPGHAKPNHVGVFSTPAIGDVNGNGWLDVAYGSFNEKIYVKDGNGADLPGWPRENLDTIWSSPALADIDGNGTREVIIGTDLGGGAAAFGCAKGIRGTLSIWNDKAEPQPNYPKCIDTPIWSSPAVQDLNGDGSLDVVAGTNNYLEGGSQVGRENVVRAWNTRSGHEMWTAELRGGSRAFASPAVGDVGGDGSLDIAVATIPSSNYGHVYLLDAKTGKVRWEREGGHHDVCACMFMGSPVIADVDGDGKPEVIATNQDGGVNAWDEQGNKVIGDLHAPPGAGQEDWDSESYMFFNSPAVSDLDGDGDNEIVLASAIKNSNPRRGKVWIVSTEGKGTGPWPMFKKTQDRLSTVGKGSSFVPSGPPPAPPAPAPAAPSGPSEGGSDTPEASAEPTDAPATDEPTPDPSDRPLAVAADDDDGGISPWLLGGAGLAVLSGGGVATYALIRRRRLSL